jgi:acyl transferase domain-containing protein/SAM-dependent methyltransferase
VEDFLNRISGYSPKRLALLADELQRRVTQLERAAHAPIAIVGMACRFPGGATTPAKLWQLLERGEDAIREVPPERWRIDDYFDANPDAPGKMSSRWGGFVDEVERFDAHFFGISPREAQRMDPQQRLLLEVAWEALENAGINADRLAETPTGVFIGMSSVDYLQLMRSAGLGSFDAYTASGAAHSIASGRLSYLLGARGPSMAIDTACSSSLVAIHQAVGSLRRGESNLALAGGVNLILRPDVTVALSKAHMMAPDGRCKVFDARADGFVRSEGCGVLVLKRLADAQADGDPIVAVIRGTASNQDGRSNGLTAPSGTAQEAVVRAALADAGLEPRELDFVETHGTGTSLGDPIEVQALAAVFADRGPERPLLIGSLKANVGHMEAAAGVASVIKLALTLEHGVVPGQPHFVEPNPFIPWAELPVRVPRTATPWPEPTSGPRLGGASSFGFSGTNVHVVLSAPPPRAPRSATLERPRQLLTLSARSDAARRALLLQMREELAKADGAPLTDVAFTANAGRAVFTHRVALVATTKAEAVKQLDELANGGAPVGVTLGVVQPRSPRIAFLFSGQGGQYAGMARALYETQPLFRELLDECDALLRPRLALPLLEVLQRPDAESSPIHETAYTQPALFAVEYALAKLWQSWGVQPTAVLGHSLGELVAVCVAGVLSLKDALLLVAERGRLMSALPQRGAMAALMTDEATALSLIAPWPAEVSLAAMNGPEHVVISGQDNAVTTILERAATAGIGSTRLTVSHAFHSPLIEPMLAELERAAAGVEHKRATIDIVSNLTGEAQSSGFDAAYWRQHARSPVRFSRAMQTLARLGYDTFVEIGPHPTLLGMARQCLKDDALAWLPSLRRGRDDWEQLLDSLAKLYVRGVNVDWERFDAGYARSKVQLPTYPFQRERFWVDVAPERPETERGLAAALPLDALGAMTHEIVWREGPIVGGALPAPGALRAVVSPRIAAIAAESGLDAYAPFVPALDELASQYILHALRQLDARLPTGSAFTTPALGEQLGVLPRHARLFERLLGILTEDGWLAASDAGFRVVRALDGQDPDALGQRLLERFPNGEAELTITIRCARELASVLRGKTDPLSLLFPGGSLADMERLYRTSAPATAYNRLLREAVIALEQAWSDERPLRILEVGGGTGSTTAYVLPALRDDRVSYTFTDLSPLFLNHARETFADRSCLRCSVLDISLDPLAQGFEPGSFDLIIGANVLHATPDLAVSLGHARRLLAPGGQLLLLEGTSPQRFGDLTVGLLEGWWAYTDVARRSYALMSRESWLAVLRETGFRDAAVIVDGDAGPVLEQQAIFVAQAPSSPRRSSGAPWLIVPDAGGAAAGALLAELRELGEAAIVLAPGAEPLADAVASATRQRQSIAGVLNLSALELQLDETTPADLLWAGQQRVMQSALDTVRTLASAPVSPQAQLWFVTRGGQATRASEASNPAQATIWGFSHVVALEHAELGCRRVDLDPDLPLAEGMRSLALELCTPSREDQLALRSDRRLLRRLVLKPSRTPAPTAQIAPDKTYLVTGGLRGLGLLVADWLVQRGARSLALMGRRAPDAATEAKLQQLRGRAAQVLVLTGDVSKEPDVRRALSEIERALPPLAGIVHSAGVLDDGVISAQTWPRFASVMAPKVLGAWHLHRLSGALDFFVLFSSGAAIAGSAGQANHAAANAFEDALAWYRQGQGKPSVSINWGPWSEVGAAADRKLNGPSFVHPISPQDGLRAFEAALSRNHGEAPLASSQVVVIATDWQELERAPSAWRSSPLFRELAPARALVIKAAPTRQAEPAPSLRERLLATAPNRRLAALQEQLRLITVKVLGAQHHGELDIHEPLRQLGLDSLMAVELRNLLASAVGRPMPATITFDYPSVSALADYFASQVFAEDLFPTAAPAAGLEPPAAATEQPSTTDDLSSDELASRLAQRLDRLFPDESQ